MRSGDGGRRGKLTSRRRVTEADEDLVVRIVRQQSRAEQSRALSFSERFQQRAGCRGGGTRGRGERKGASGSQSLTVEGEWENEIPVKRNGGQVR